MDWKNKDGDKYTDRNSPDLDKRIKWFNEILPKDVKSVFEIGCNKGHNLEAIEIARGIEVVGKEINKKAAQICQSKGIKCINDDLFSDDWHASDLLLCSGILIHINPIKLGVLFDMLRMEKHKYILIIEHKEESIRTINSRWYKNAMWVMDFGQELENFTKGSKFGSYKIVKQGWVNGKKPKVIDYTAPLTTTKTGFHQADYFWLLRRR